MLQPAVPVTAPRSLPPISNPPLMLEDAATIAVDALGERFPRTDPRVLTFPTRQRALFAWDDGEDIRSKWVSITELGADATISAVAQHLFDHAAAAIVRRD